MHHCFPYLNIVSTQSVSLRVSLVLKEIVDKALKVFTVVDNLKAALSGCRLGKKLEEFFEVPFQLSDFPILQSWRFIAVPDTEPHACLHASSPLLFLPCLSDFFPL